MQSRTDQLFETLFKIRPDEVRRTVYASIYLFFIIGAFIIARVSRSVLFLELPDYKEQLPFTYVGIAIVVPLSMYFYSRFERRLRRDKTNAYTLIGLLASTLIFRLALIYHNTFTAWAFYLWVEVFGSFLIVQFWTLCNEIMNARQARRLFAVIGGGGVLANVVIGFAIKSAVKLVGTENLLFAIAVCLCICFWCVKKIGRECEAELNLAKDRGPVRKRRGDDDTKSQKVFGTRHVQLIALLVVLTYIVSTLVDYQFQVIVADTIASKDDRGAYFGAFFGYTGILSAFIQFFLTSRLLERFGVTVALLLLPIGMLAGSIGLLNVQIFTALGAVTFTKGSENVLRYTINDSTMQILYMPVPAHLRGRAKAFIDGILKPVAIGFAGLLAAILVGQLDQLTGKLFHFAVNIYSLSWCVGVALVVWICVLFLLRKEYLKSLMQTLQRRRLNFAEASYEIGDEPTLSILRNTLRAEDPIEIVHGVELVRYVSPQVRPSMEEAIVALLKHPSEDVRVVALAYLGEHSATLHGEQVAALLTDGSEKVRAAAIFAYTAIYREHGVNNTALLLSDESLNVRGAAVAGLIRFGGLDGVLAAADQLKTMFNHKNDDERAKGAWVLEQIGLQNFHQPLIRLLSDPSERVRLAAILAAGKLKSPELIPHLIMQLDRQRLAGATTHVLSSYGITMYESAVAVLRDRSQPQPIREAMPRILARLPQGKGVDILTELIVDSDMTMRQAALQALVFIVQHTPNVVLNQATIFKALCMESQSYIEVLAVQVDLALDDKAQLLTDAIAHSLEQTLNRMLLLLSLKYSPKTIQTVHQNLVSKQPAARANAVELMDNLLGKEEKPWIIPLLDDAEANRKLQAMQDLHKPRRSNRHERLREVCISENAWLQACAMSAIGAYQLEELAPDVRAMLTSKNALCRETAIHVSLLLGPKEMAASKSRMQPLIDDPTPFVARFARFALSP